MAHIHTGKNEHDHTASAFIVRLDMDEPRILLHMHKKLGVLVQIGGHIELTENPWEAVLHEITEESGYDAGQLELLQPQDRLKELHDILLHPIPLVKLTHQFSEDHFHDDTGWAFVTNQPPKHKISTDESQDLRYLSSSDLRALPTQELPKNVQQVSLYILENCVPNWERIKL